jgi:hypothetical protein
LVEIVCQGKMSATKMVRTTRRLFCGDVYSSITLALVVAAQTIANIVKSSLGPLGLDKMLVDNIGVRTCVQCLHMHAVSLTATRLLRRK